MKYGPFGETIRITGLVAKMNPLRFSTQYADDVTGDLKYLYREYAPGTGRWKSRDPAGERPVLNLFAFVSNRPVDGIDIFGLVTGSFGAQHSYPLFRSGMLGGAKVGWSVRFEWHPPSSWPAKCPACEEALWIQRYSYISTFWARPLLDDWGDDWTERDYKGFATLWRNGVWARGNSGDVSEMWDDAETWGPFILSSTILFRAESCVKCLKGPEAGTFYGCYYWGYSIFDDSLSGGVFEGPYDGPRYSGTQSKRQ